MRQKTHTSLSDPAIITTPYCERCFTPIPQNHHDCPECNEGVVRNDKTFVFSVGFLVIVVLASVVIIFRQLF